MRIFCMIGSREEFSRSEVTENAKKLAKAETVVQRGSDVNAIRQIAKTYRELASVGRSSGA